MTSVAFSASSDAMAITHRLEARGEGILGDELHFFAYFACLLAVYEGQVPSEWGYSFTATPTGAPFSSDLERAVASLRTAGLLIDDGPLYRLSAAGREREAQMSMLRQVATRRRYVAAATAAAVLMPLPAVRDAMRHEPHLSQAMSAPGARRLLDDTGLLMVKNQFGAIRAAFAQQGVERRALVVPAMVWLGSLQEQAGHGETGI